MKFAYIPFLLPTLAFLKLAKSPSTKLLDYQAMLQELDASEPEMIGDQQFSYDNVNNPLPGIYYPPEEEEYQELLDYVLVSNAHLQPVDSHCEILTPVWPENCGNDVSCQVSDHYPVTCTYTFATTVATTE